MCAVHGIYTDNQSLLCVIARTYHIIIVFVFLPFSGVCVIVKCVTLRETTSTAFRLYVTGTTKYDGI